MQQPGLRLNAAAFHTKMEDLQVTLDAGSCSSRVVFNVPKAHSSGVELEMTLRPNDSLELGLSRAAVNAEFDSTVRDGTGAVLGGIREGNRLPSVPAHLHTQPAFPGRSGDRGDDGDLVVRGMSVRTREAYLRAAARLAKYYGRRPDRVSEQEVQDYLVPAGAIRSGMHAASRSSKSCMTRLMVSNRRPSTSIACGVWM